MSEYPVGSTAKVYQDQEGNDVTLRQLIRLEPEWAHTRIVQCEALEAESRWIPVEERLPEDAKPVIVHGGCGHYSHKYKAWFTNMEREKFGDEYRPILWEVTHWMPLPSPPALNQSGSE